MLPSAGAAAPSHSFFVSTWPETWVDTYVGEELARLDPTVTHARRSAAPATWSELAPGKAPRLTPGEIECIQWLLAGPGAALAVHYGLVQP